MTVVSSAVVRVGVLVEKFGEKPVESRFTVFYCRSKDKGDATHCPVSEWVGDEINYLMRYYGGFSGHDKIPVGGRARYWAQLRLTCTRDYWGDFDSEVEVIKCRRI
jgi:hypothetical protein